ncbi:MAG: hypothetical protein HQK58_02285 [Deltaproteobacteria bacterium]|nr:hypothetical protein [Deltaproteobacteria bacterium]
MELWIGALNLGFLYAFMTMGVFITFRIHDFPDITVDGSFVLGAAVTGVLLVQGVNPVTSLLVAFLAGAASGMITAVIHNRLNVNGLLAGIIVMTGLYSINLHIMGRSNIPLINHVTVMSYIDRMNPGLTPEIWMCLTLGGVIILFGLIMAWFFRTNLGLAMRMTGNNPIMAAATGVNVDRMKMLGVALANGLTGLSGGLVAQYQGFADIGMGIGTVVIGLAAVIIGESVLRMRSIYAKVFSAIVGSLIFRLMIAVALAVGMDPTDLKLLTAAFVLLTLAASKATAGKQALKTAFAQFWSKSAWNRRNVSAAVCLALVLTVAGWGYKRYYGSPVAGPDKVYKIGVVQLVDNPLLNMTRDGLLGELKKMGYESGKNCVMLEENAHGDMSTVNNILDKFKQQQIDLIVPISTACTQAAISKFKDRPVVFAGVASPFIIGAGQSDTDHLPNVTGVYGGAPATKMMDIVRRFKPGKIKIGTIWDPSQANSVFNVDHLQEIIKDDKNITFVGTTVTNSSEVSQAATSLVHKGLDVFTLVPDNIVYSAFESVLKAARAKNIPIFINDVERLADGAFCAIGYDYTSVGIQAAHLVDRIIKGEKPQDIPFEKNKKLTFGFNLDTAKELGITIPSDLLAQANRIVGRGAEATVKASHPTTPASARTATPSSGQKTASALPAAADKGTSAAVKPPEKRLVVFIFSETPPIMDTRKGVLEELTSSGVLKKYNISVDHKSAQAEFYLAQSIAGDIMRLNYDYIITLSTPALQIMAQANKRIPQIFGGVTDPYRMGIAKTADDHLPNITGVATMHPVSATIAAIREIMPQAKTIGTVWNPAEATAETCTYAAREAVKQYGFQLLETNISQVNDISEALNALVRKKIDVLFTSGDNSINLAVDFIGKTMKQHKIPYFTTIPSDAGRGASLLSIGADYVEVGRETARQAILVITGQDPKNVPIKNYVPKKMVVNAALAREYGIALPDSILKQATEVRR